MRLPDLTTPLQDIMDLTPPERAEIDRELPPIWTSAEEREDHPDWDVLNLDRIEFYTRLCHDHALHWDAANSPNGIRGGFMTIPEFIAAMLMEAGLENLNIGENARHRFSGDWAQPPDGPYFPTLGISWIQHDTSQFVRIDRMHTIRRDPVEALDFAFTRGLIKNVGTYSDFQKQLWHAWEEHIIDPAEGWNPKKACVDMWFQLYPVETS